MSEGVARAAKTIRMREDVYHQARVAAVISRKTLGQWIEEALLEKAQRQAIDLPANLQGDLDVGRSGNQGREP